MIPLPVGTGLQRWQRRPGDPRHAASESPALRFAEPPLASGPHRGESDPYRTSCRAQCCPSGTVPAATPHPKSGHRKVLPSKHAKTDRSGMRVKLTPEGRSADIDVGDRASRRGYAAMVEPGVASTRRSASAMPCFAHRSATTRSRKLGSSCRPVGRPALMNQAKVLKTRSPRLIVP